MPRPVASKRVTSMNQHNIDNNSSNSQAWPGFCYVDFTSKTGGWQKWRRIPIEHVAQYAKKAGNTDVFITIQRFSNPQQKDAEAHVCHLYFDLDSDLPKGDLSPVLEEAQKLVEYLNTELELPKDLGSIPHAGCGVCRW